MVGMSGGVDSSVAALLLLEQARLSQDRPVRHELVAPGLRDGWTRTVAALLRETALLGTPERRLASAWLALQEAVAAEADLLLAAREASPDELAVKVQGQTSLDPTLAADLVVAVAESPLEALAAGLAHEGLQEWFSDDGQDPVEFLRQAWAGGGLSVPLARWASQPVDH